MNILDDAMKQPKKDTLLEHKSAIEVLREKGYTWREIAQFLTERGIETDHTKIYKLIQRSNKMISRGSYDR